MYILKNVGISAIIAGSILHINGVQMLIDKSAHHANITIFDNDLTSSNPANAINEEATIN
jgi:hypothetical protein